MNAVRTRILFIALIAALLVAAVPAFAQSGLNPWASPSYGSVSLAAGFLPDPYYVEITSGGSLSAAVQLSNECSGFISSAPDFRLYWTGVTSDLFIGFEAYFANDDTTLVVRDPNGNYYCDDDTFGLDPEVWLTWPVAGSYQIWVGSYRSGEYHRGELYISEIG